MKAISLWEPWASLVRTGAKHWETRSWSTPYRGRLLICAAKAGLSRDGVIFLLSRGDFQAGLAPLVGHSLDLNNLNQWPGVKLQHLYFGRAVAIVELLDCKPTGALTQEEIGTDRPFGDFSSGRFAWRLNLLRRDFEPFPVQGHQGFFDVPDVEIEKALYEMAGG